MGKTNAGPNHVADQDHSYTVYIQSLQTLRRYIQVWYLLVSLTCSFVRN